MLQILTLVTPLFALILIGYVAGRTARIPVAGLAWLNFFIVYVSLPALFFRLLSATPVSEFANTDFMLRAALGTFIVFALCFLIALAVSREGVKVATIQGLAGAYGNIGYLGPPLAIAAFGPQAGVPVALIFCLDNTMHFTVTPLLMAMGGSSVRSVAAVGRVVVGIVKKIVFHPFILATLAGVGAAWLEWDTPALIDDLLESLAGAAAPCALFAMGVTAALRPLKRIPVELAYLVPFKLLVHPLIVYLMLVSLPELPPVWLYSAVLLAALPTATNVYVLAQQNETWAERASSAVVISTACSVLTITVFLYFTKALVQ